MCKKSLLILSFLPKKFSFSFPKILVALVYRHLAVNGGNGGVKNKMVNNGLILTGKKYVVQIYKIKLHTKNHVDWIKNEVPREV